MVLIVFKKKWWGANGPFWTQKWQILITLDLPLIFFLILHNEIIMVCNNNGLYQNFFVQDKGAILDPKLAHPHNSG